MPGSRTRIGGTEIAMDTDYPFEDTVAIRASGGEGRLLLRIPSRCRKPRAMINGSPATLKKGRNGYAAVAFKDGTEITLSFPMDIVFNKADYRVEDDRNKLCVTCGPLVFCAEEADNGSPDALAIEKKEACRIDGYLYGRYPAIIAAGRDTERDQPKEVVLIPCFLWDNREPGAMKVWLPESRPKRSDK